MCVMERSNKRLERTVHTISSMIIFSTLSILFKPVNRGFMSAAGQPDVSRSARLFLKEAASGRLHWEQLPPGYQPAPLNCRIQEKRNETRKPTPRETRMVEGWRNTSAEIDSTFFAMKKSTSHVKGKPILG
ncbi:Large subunit GTPase 1-like [Papilio machaon]|uniref:Large subunit GTPase 1-like n=1 Tax=Papilio machaon TaxID=76193 RepID=A0A0N1IJN6_PAPMA|nr:Large subunit GTPase 1-like [Papilio machaon]